MIKYEPTSGHINDAIERAIKMAQIAKHRVQLTFNGDAVTVCAYHADQVYQEWAEKRAARQLAEHINVDA